MQSWFDSVNCSHPSFGNVLSPAITSSITSVDSFLNSILVVPIEHQPRLIELAIACASSSKAAKQVGLEKLSSRETRIVRTRELYSNSSTRVSAKTIEVDQSIGFAAADELRRQHIARHGGMPTAAFCLEKWTHQMALVMLRDATAGSEHGSYRVVMPHNRSMPRPLTGAQISRNWQVIFVDGPHFAQWGRYWDGVLQQAMADNLHKVEMHLLVGSVSARARADRSALAVFDMRGARSALSPHRSSRSGRASPRA